MRRGRRAVAAAFTAAETARSSSESPLILSSSSSYLTEGFAWAKRTALGKVHPDNGGCYQAALQDRGGYCQRDYVHQIDGAALLGLHRENLAMLRCFATNQTKARGWFTLWEINYDGTPMACDYRDDGNFWRNTAGMFDLLHGAYRMHRWTGDPALVQDALLQGFYARTANEFVAEHDRNGNGIAEGASSHGWGISCTYNEIPGKVLAEAADSLGTQHRAFEAYAHFLRAKGDGSAAQVWADKADRLKRVFNDTWYDAAAGRFLIGFDHPGYRPVNAFGYETSWFIPYTGLCEPGPRATAYLDFIHDSFQARPSPQHRGMDLSAGRLLCLEPERAGLAIFQARPGQQVELSRSVVHRHQPHRHAHHGHRTRRPRPVGEHPGTVACGGGLGPAGACAGGTERHPRPARRQQPDHHGHEQRRSRPHLGGSLPWRASRRPHRWLAEDGKHEAPQWVLGEQCHHPGQDWAASNRHHRTGKETELIIWGDTGSEHRPGPCLEIHRSGPVRPTATARPADNTVELQLEPNAIYTCTSTTGQQKGSHGTPPARKPFPFPFQDNFESYASGDTPRYFSDQKGTFEVSQSPKGGLCLAQIVPAQGILWFALAETLHAVGRPELAGLCHRGRCLSGGR